MTGRLKGGRDERLARVGNRLEFLVAGSRNCSRSREVEMSFAEKKSQWLVEEREVVWNSGDRSRDK